LTQKDVHALSSMYRRKLNKMGDNWFDDRCAIPV
jgi:hypothetical protein